MCSVQCLFYYGYVGNIFGCLQKLEFFAGKWDRQIERERERERERQRETERETYAEKRKENTNRRILLGLQEKYDNNLKASERMFYRNKIWKRFKNLA